MWDRNRKMPRDGLDISGRGTATLQNALVLVQPWHPKKVEPSNVISSWGGILGLACRYTYQKLDGSLANLLLYIEYLHLITEEYLPIDTRGNQMTSLNAWLAMGKKAGFGPAMQNNTLLSASQLTAGNPLLVGYLGATAGPHVHINANYNTEGKQRYTFFPRFDPRVMMT
jgi:hypothetical protein